ncbi:MAG: hypothetical protein K2O16_17085 [Lachnospiraceae bacterium]|nr:hypothetical protein [Lachnospiraceae bacterium]
MSMNVNGSTQQAGTEWFQNMKQQKPNGKAVEARLPKADRAVNVTISKEGIKSLKNGGKEVGQKESIMQASKSIRANYGYRLAEEAGKLKGQRESGAAYSLSDRAADYVEAYGNLYDEIVQGYKDGTMERYVEDTTSETGFRKMTMEEELADLDKAFQSVADKAEVDAKASRILDGYKERLSKLKSGQKLSADSDKTGAVQENVNQKLVTLAQAWKDAYKVSGSKESGMEKVLSMLNGMFGIKNEA